MIQYGETYYINNGRESIIFSEGKENTINGKYKSGTLSGTLVGNLLKGTYHNKKTNGAGLIEIEFSVQGFSAKWKQGLEPGPMKGRWKGTLEKNEIDSMKPELSTYSFKEPTSIEIKNFRFFKVKEDNDIYGQIIKPNYLISAFNYSDRESLVFLGSNESCINLDISSINTERLMDIAKNIDVEAELLTCLTICANDQDDDGLCDYIEENGGKANWFNLMRNPLEEEELNNLVGNVGVLVSSAEIEVDSINSEGFVLDGEFIKFSNSLGYYDEDSEMALIYSK